MQVLGTCSICGGRVTLPTVWWGVIPPTPTCESCGATARQHGPVIDMEPVRYGTTYGNGVESFEKRSLDAAARLNEALLRNAPKVVW